MKHYEKLLLLRNIPKFGNVKINKELGSAILRSESFSDFLDDLKRSGVKEDDIQDALFNVEQTKKIVSKINGLSIITIYDDEYPERFNALGNSKPVILYAMGEVSLLREKTLAIIGTRHPGEYTINVGRRIVNRVAKERNLVIVSGLALGCDMIAHEEVLKCNGRTIAVLPSGLNKISPKSNIPLARQIVKNGGLILAEYDPQIEANRFTPVQRDALVAALSDKVFVLECGIKSGTMHTVKHALKMRKPIAVLDGADSIGDFSGNEEILNKSLGVKISNEDDLDRFISYTEYKAKDNQLSFI